MRSSLFAVALLAALTNASTTILPNTCFDSQSSLEQYFSYNYPWGDTHNGAARMNKANAKVSGGVLTLTSDYTQNSDYAWTSGTIYAKQHFTVATGGFLDFTASFIAPTSKGTWPALWLNGVNSWPPEIDVAEWKGDGKISFNTFNTSSAVAALDKSYPSPGSWHTVEATLRDNGGGVVATTFKLDGVQQTVQYGKGMVGQPFELIIDYQMEGSSGSPGPHSTTEFQIKGLKVTSS